MHLSSRSAWSRVAVQSFAGLVFCIGAAQHAVAQSQEWLLPADRQEIADQERLSWTLDKFPAQPCFLD